MAAKTSPRGRKSMFHQPQAESGGDVERTLDMANYVTNRLEQIKKTQTNTKKLTQLYSFIPDFVLMDEANRKIPYQFSFEGVVLMADISGFTALTEAYSLKGKGGTDQLTKTLAGYIGPLAEAILLAGGDIVKYAGDAFIAYWKSGPSDYEEDIQRVVDCALYIQEKYGTYLCKDVDITIRVKIGIGAGNIHFSGIGTEAYQHWVAFGPGVEAASSAEKYCVPGDTVLDPSAWNFCSPSNFRYIAKEPPFIHITDITNFINFEKRGRPLLIGSAIIRDNKKQSNIPVIDLDKIRPKVNMAAERKPESMMRPYVIPPVLRNLDEDIPVEYLNESRVVCICFIHLKTDEKVDQDEKNFRENMATIVQRAFVRIYTNVSKMSGALSKVIMFDKGLTYLVVFGLPGYINENQSAHALKFSYRTRLQLKTIKYVTDCSIGVTTGSCYCGVIGHPRRQEYTVIGRKVNKAARLMCYYPGKLTCDQDTAYFSKLSPDNFQLMEAKQLKGIKDAGHIFEFAPQDVIDDTSIPSFIYPILGREAELTYFRNAMTRVKKDFENRPKMVSALLQKIGQDISGTQKPVWMIVFEGDNGIGKSRMLAACINTAEELKVSCFDVGMTLSSSSQPLFAISSLIIDALGMIELRTAQEREDYLRKHLTDSDLSGELCLLNDVLLTRFPLNPKYNALDVNAGHTYAHHVLYNLLKATYPDKLLLFVVDDAHLMDHRSWEFLIHISKYPNFFALCSLRRSNAGSPKLPEAVSKLIYHNKHIKIIRMTGLDPRMLLPLACQIMQVKSIPADLEKIILNKSNGVPAWVNQVLNELLRQGIIRLQEDNFKYKQAMVSPEKKYLEKLKKAPRKVVQRFAHDETETEDAARGKRSTSAIKEYVNPFDRVLVIKSDTNIHNVPVSGTLKEILLDAYDELNPNEQIILKAATVLGLRFSRRMVTQLLPSYDLWARKYDVGFNHLMEIKFLRCASGTQKQKEQASGINKKPQCFCRLDSFACGDDGNCEKQARPKYYSCKFMEFVKENMVEVVYDVMTEDQRVEFHLKAAKYLDASSIRCESCGGEDRSHMFGFVRKANEYSVEAEEALRLSGKQGHKRRSKVQAREEFRRLSNISFKTGEKMKKSPVTQMHVLRRTFDSFGWQLGHLELDILRGLVEFEKETQKSSWKDSWCCSRRKMAQEIENEEIILKELEHEEKELRPKDSSLTVSDQEVKAKTNSVPAIEIPSIMITDTGIGAHKGGGRGGGGQMIPDSNLEVRRRTAASASSTSANSPRFGSSLDNTGGQFLVDLRMCQCAVLQAKVCVDRVWHYREAKKYGKCLQNLLDAAEADVTVGNGLQALVHIEDALGLLQRVKAGDLTAPDKDDPDDCLINEKDAEAYVEFLSGLAYFEIGVNGKAREFFLKALKRLGLVLNYEDSSFKRDLAIKSAKMKLFWVRHCSCCGARKNKEQYAKKSVGDEDEPWEKKLRILAYLHSLFKSEKKIEMALLVTLWEVIIAEEYGDIIHHIIPAYSNLMDIYSMLSNHRMAKKYEKMALTLIRNTLGSDDQIETFGLVTSANLFFNIAMTRLNRGEIESSGKAAYLSLTISQTIHDNSLTVRILPLLCQSLLLSLNISEVAEALQKLWFLAEESDDYAGVSHYYATCLDLLLNTAYPLEQFGVCENFVSNGDWTSDSSVFKDLDVQFSMEASLALWYARYSKWEQAQKWFDAAEKRKPKNHNFVTVSSELKLLECKLIFVNHFLDSKRYQLFAKSRNEVKEWMRTLAKSTSVVPVLKPRYLHLQAYYYRIRSRNVEAEKNLRNAEKMAVKMGNYLEQEWIIHSRNVWADLAIPTIKYFWLEHTENHTLDWHSSGKIPWANIMYSLPLPAWK